MNCTDILGTRTFQSELKVTLEISGKGGELGERNIGAILGTDFDSLLAVLYWLAVPESCYCMFPAARGQGK